MNTFTINNFTFTEKEIPDVFDIDIKVYDDNRGYFMETYQQQAFDEAGLDFNFVQDNQSSSRRGVLRGLHFQKQFPQAKLVRVIFGEVYDVAVDLRNGSPTFGKWCGSILTAEKKNMLLIPRGFAHGFVVLSDYAEFTYKCDEFYHHEDEGGIIWNDPDIGIEWPYDGALILSDKDKKHPTLSELNFRFHL